MNSKLRFFLLSLAGLGVGAAVALMYLYEPWVPRAPPQVAEASATSVDDALEEWSRSFPNLVGNVDELLASGQNKLLLDRTSSYREAETDFQRAFLLDPSSEPAVVGYVQAVALSRGETLDEAGFRTSLGLVRWAEERGGAQPEELVAHALLLLTRPTVANLTNARALADRAAQSEDSKVRALAFLAKGRSYLNVNLVWAAENIEKAVELDPGSRQSHLYRARVARSRGDIKGAVESLEARLGLDEDQWEVTQLLVNAYLEVGEVALAKSLLERIIEKGATGHRALLTLGVLQYQVEQKGAQAAATFEALLQRVPDSDVALRAEALGHQAAARRLAGLGELANRAATAALVLEPTQVQARLQLFLLEVSKRATSVARGHFVLLQGKLGDEAQESVLEGLLLLAERNWKSAQLAFEKAATVDARRLDAMVLAAAAALKASDEQAASYWMFERATRADPLRLGPTPVLSSLFLDSRRLLEDEWGTFSKLRTGALDPNSYVAQALVLFHLKSFARAEGLLEEALRLDPGHATALALSALISVQGADPALAKKLGTQARLAGSLLALNHFAFAETRRLLRNLDEAREGYEQALKLDTSFKAAKVRLSEVEAQLGQKDAAVERLLSVLRVDPTYYEAHRVLYSLPK